MKTTYNYVKSGAAAVLCLSMIAPSTVYAAQMGGSAPRAGVNQAPIMRGDNAFCTRLESVVLSATNRLTERYGLVVERGRERQSTLQNRRNERDRLMNEARNNAEQVRGRVAAQLEERAKNDSQKQALIKFQEEVKNAVETRQNAVDTAIKAYRDGLDTRAKDAEKAAQSAADEYKTAIDAALQAAKASCSAGEDAAAIRQAYSAAVKLAQSALLRARQALQNREGDLKELSRARNEAVKKAVAEFQAAMEKARAELKAVFGGTTSLNGR